MINETQHNTITLVGMDAHSEHISLCITTWAHGSDPVVTKAIDTTLESLETTYKKHVSIGSLTVLEASTNSFSIHDRLFAVGYKAKVLASDTLAGRSRADNVNDRSDAKKLAYAYARGGVREVHVPSIYYRNLRNIFFGYRNAVKDTTRCSNRLWSFCSQYGLQYPKARYSGKVSSIRTMLKDRKWSDDDLFHIELMLQVYQQSLERRDAYEKHIVEIIHSNKQMTSLMQILGIRFITAFALVAFIEDISRFNNPKKLVAYIGLNPTVYRSGKSEGPTSVSRYGRSDLKSLLAEAAQAAYRSGGTQAAKWARRKVAFGKERNVAICGLARKMVMKAWHILMGHPVPDREDEKSFTLKLRKVAFAMGKEKLKELGYKNSKQYAEAICSKLYVHLDNKLQTAAPASS